MNGAVQAISQAEQALPGNSMVVNELGLTLQNAGRKKEARDVYEQAIKLDPQDGLALNNLAFLIAEGGNGDLDQSLTYAQRAKQSLPNLGEVSRHVGLDLPEEEHERQRHGGLPELSEQHAAQRDIPSSLSDGLCAERRSPKRFAGAGAGAAQQSRQGRRATDQRSDQQTAGIRSAADAAPADLIPRSTARRPSESLPAHRRPSGRRSA